jgi:hypothetical protein
MVKFMNWAQGVLTLHAGAWENVADVPLLFKMHLVLGMTIFLLFPFTRLVHVWSAHILIAANPDDPQQVGEKRKSALKLIEFLILNPSMFADRPCLNLKGRCAADARTYRSRADPDALRFSCRAA